MGGNKTPSQPTNTRETSSSDEKSGAGQASQQRALQESATVALKRDLTGDYFDVYGGICPYTTNILEPLVWVGDDMTLVPWLAKDWKATGEKTWEFSLREDVTFHNGKPLNADAVVFSFEELFAEWEWFNTWLNLKPDGVRKIDGTTVEFETTKHYPTLPGSLAHNMVAIQHPERSRKKGEVIATGPFQVTDRKKSQYVQTKAFEDYWNEKPILSKLRFRIITDPNTRALALKGHEVDVAFTPPTSRVQSLEQGENTRIEKQLSTFSTFAGLNLYKSPTDDVKLRQGMNWAVSQQLLVEQTLNGIGVPAKGPYSNIIYWSAHKKLPAYGPDKTKAKQLVEESSYDGESLKLLVSTYDTYGKLVSQVLQQMLDDIGVTVEIRMMKEAAYAAATNDGDGHMFLTTSGAISGAADTLIYGMFHSKGGWNRHLYKKNGTGLYNLGGRVDELIEKGLQTSNPEVKERAYEKALQIIMRKGVIVPLHYHEYVVGARDDIGGLDLTPIKEMIRWVGLKHYDMS